MSVRDIATFALKRAKMLQRGAPLDDRFGDQDWVRAAKLAAAYNVVVAERRALHRTVDALLPASGCQTVEEAVKAFGGPE